MAQPRFTFQDREYDLVDVDELTLREMFELRRVVGADASPREALAGVCWMSVRAVKAKTTWEWFLDHVTNADLHRFEREIEASDESADDAADEDDGEGDGPPLRAVSASGGGHGTSASTTSTRGGSRTSRSKS